MGGKAERWRVGKGHRAVGILDGDEIVWFWIGSHKEYQRIIAETREQRHPAIVAIWREMTNHRVVESSESQVVSSSGPQ
jgi:hypothetical protein